MFPIALFAFGAGLALLVGRRGFGHARRFGRGFGGRGWWRMARYLDLDAAQREAAWQVVKEVRQSARRIKWELRGQADELVDALAGDTFDRGRMESAAGKLDELRAAVLDGLGRLHQILTPEQRQ